MYKFCKIFLQNVLRCTETLNMNKWILCPIKVVFALLNSLWILMHSRITLHPASECIHPWLSAKRIARRQTQLRTTVRATRQGQTVVASLAPLRLLLLLLQLLWSCCWRYNYDCVYVCVCVCMQMSMSIQMWLTARFQSRRFRLLPSSASSFSPPPALLRSSLFVALSVSVFCRPCAQLSARFALRVSHANINKHSHTHTPIHMEYEHSVGSQKSY